MNACPERLEAISLAAAGEPSAELRAHAATCEGCRAELEAVTSVLAAAAAPVFAAPADLAARTLRGWPRRRSGGRTLRVAAVAAAVVAAFLVGGAVRERQLRRAAPVVIAPEESDDAYDPLEAWARTDDPLSDAVTELSTVEGDDSAADAPTEDGATVDDPLLDEEGTDG